MRRAIMISSLLLALSAMLSVAQDGARPDIGIMWNRSGLPATLPLQIRSEGQMDHAVFLSRPGADSPEMAGYVRSGAFFRLLVPPGDWQIRIASGSEWQGESEFFGDDTIWTELPEALNFMAGEAQLNGHSLTLIEDRGDIEITTIKPRILCRVPSWRKDLFDRAQQKEAREGDLPQEQYTGAPPGYDPVPEPMYFPDREFRLRSVLCD
ncbi:hypothetical protein [Paracoccus aerodenitrificans]|uniref:hypothetical protein n=1 Tax=Paracoccus aerodenitrificans TaxID=3017781 RepID=UPI0022F0613B|nr:hypothetical protein [Paracoccus aerodenitrificans]WBU65280.1 hypothetical protein PAE61_07645 [Paracoccus aerodenitrificans]